MNSCIGVCKAILGGQKDGAFYSAEGRFQAVVIIEEDQGWTEKKTGEKIDKLVSIPFKFGGKWGEAINDTKYIGQMVKVDYDLGGWNPEGDKWYPNLNGKFMHRWEGEAPKAAKKEQEEIAF
jgi:hypothetical protein